MIKAEDFVHPKMDDINIGEKVRLSPRKGETDFFGISTVIDKQPAGAGSGDVLYTIKSDSTGATVTTGRNGITRKVDYDK